MTTQQTIVVAVLWLAVAGLFGLVLLLYRAVERAYDHGGQGQGGLLPGAEAPPVEILTGSGIDFLEPVSQESPYVLAFVSGDCEDCVELVDALLDHDVDSAGTSLVHVGGRPFERDIAAGSGVTLHPAAHPPDIQRGYGVTVFPLVYAMRGSTVLAVSRAASPEGLRALMQDARSAMAKLDEPVQVVMAGGARGADRE